MKNFIDCNALMEILNEKNTFVFDCRFDLFNPKDYGKDAYKKEHIKGAYYLDIDNDLCMCGKIHGGARMKADTKNLGKKLAEIGVNMDSNIIIYDDKVYSSPRAWWQFKYMGYKNVYVLNGGLNSWKKNNYPTDNIIPNDKNNGSFKQNIDESIYCDIDYVKNCINKKNIAIVDCRNADRYSGKIEPLYSKKGHIPTALNLNWFASINKDGYLHDLNTLNENYEHLKKFDEIIFYCGSAIQAPINMMAMLETGDYNIKIYIGSMSDWVSFDENEVESSFNYHVENFNK